MHKNEAIKKSIERQSKKNLWISRKMKAKKLVKKIPNQILSTKSPT
jgi:hypothetical protein